MRSVTVNAVLNGWTVQCGCQTLVYTDADKLVGDLRDYMNDPKAKEKAMIESAVNKRLMSNIPQPDIQQAPPLTAMAGANTEQRTPRPQQELPRQ
jgi:hypothetical protein